MSAHLATLIAQVPKDWRIHLERLPIPNGPRWLATIRPHGKDGYVGGWSETPEEAIDEALTLMMANMEKKITEGEK